MSGKWPCPACNEFAVWSYVAVHECGGTKDDAGHAMPLNAGDDEPGQPSGETEERQ